MSRLSCEQAVELIMDFLKRELPPEVAQAMQDHIDECRPCEQHVNYESRFVLILGNRLGKERCPETLKAKLLDSLARDRGE
jgi:mycothiol system anti-sigma-R factor